MAKFITSSRTHRKKILKNLPHINHTSHIPIMSVGSVVPFINDFTVINGEPTITVGGPIPDGHTRVTVLEFWAT